jgi:aryl-alcohol dehydrogenase-like predicted oxidoreductase
MPRRIQPFPLVSAPNVDTAHLRATDVGTASYGHRFRAQFASDFYRTTTFGPTVSSIGIGTYLGDSTDEDDSAYESAVRLAIASGINLIDTAINYRSQRSERNVGAAIQDMLASAEVSRQELVVCSKGGYIPLDLTPPASRKEYRAYVQREFIDPQIVHSEEIVAGGHVLAPRFLKYCLAKSRQNLGLRTIDVYYVHNPAQQLSVVTPDELMSRMRSAFAVLEEATTRGEIGVYGCATWDDLLTPPGQQGHLSLEDLVNVARSLAGDDHHFRAIQLPINLMMLDGVRGTTQVVGGKAMSVVEAAAELGLTVFASATLMQSRLSTGLPPAVRDAFPTFATDSQRAIAFSRALPGVASALVGMKRLDHVRENVQAGRGESTSPG